MKNLRLLMLSIFCCKILFGQELGLYSSVVGEDSVDEQAKGVTRRRKLHPGLYYGKVSNNFITNVAFRELFPLRFERNGYNTFDPNTIKSGDIVFIDNPRAFLHKVHPHVKHPYIIVSHNHSLHKFTDEFLPYLNDDKIIAWFGVHPEASIPHKKFFPIPIGVTLFRQNLHAHHRQTNDLLAELRSKPKQGLLYMNFAEVRDHERTFIREWFSNKPFCFHRARRLPVRSFLKEMASYKFTLSPRGVGIDCFRTWEALLVGTIPIVKSSQLDPLYKDLPVVIIEDWKEVTQEFLESKYKEITAKKYNIEKLYVEYWKSKVQLAQKKFFRHRPIVGIL